MKMTALDCQWFSGPSRTRVFENSFEPFTKLVVEPLQWRIGLPLLCERRRRRHRTLASRCRGFTLIELLVAMTLLTLALLGTARLTTVVIRGNAASRAAGSASVLGQELLEEARRSAALPSAGTEDYGTIPGYPEFKRSVGREENTPDWGLTTVTVTVRWHGDARSLRLQTIVAP